MKNVFIISFILTLFMAKSQENKGVQFGVNQGVTVMFNSAIIKIDNLDSENAEEGIGFFAGFYADYILSEKFHVQPSINMYSNLSRDFHVLQLPIMMKYYFTDKFNFQVGPQFMYNAFGSDKYIYGNEQKFYFSGVLGIGFDISEKVSLDSRYSLQFNNGYKGEQNITSKINLLSLSVGVDF